MKFHELYQKINAKDFDNKLPYPPFRKDLTERRKHTNEDALIKETFRKEENRLQSEFKKMLRECCEDRLGEPLTDTQWGALWYKAYEDGHPYGYYEITNTMDNLLDLIEAFLR